jgi:Xaa-Pro aminopeptidase
MKIGYSSVQLAENKIPLVLSMRERNDFMLKVLHERLDNVLPIAMKESKIDMWIILCQEDNPDPIFSTMIPIDTWCPILQILVFFIKSNGEIERINVSGTETFDLYDRPYTGQIEKEQWNLLKTIVEDRKPNRIGINIGSVAWAAGGLTYNLYCQLLEHLPKMYHERLESAEGLVTRWASTLTDNEIILFNHAAMIAHQVIAECYSRKVIMPGETTSEDLRWHFWQKCSDIGMQMAFRPSFTIKRSDAMKQKYGEDDKIIRPGDLIHCDVGLIYLGINTDMQEWAYILKNDETDSPQGMQNIMNKANTLQDIFMHEFSLGLTGNQLLKNILSKAKTENIPNPKVYSHSLGHFLHEPGPLIGLPWEQDSCVGRGDVKLEYNYCFTMELSVTAPLPEWNGQDLRFSMEEDVVFTEKGCKLIDGRQREFYLI